MFSMFTGGRSTEAATPSPDPVITAPASTCCEHCRLRPPRTPEQLLAGFIEPPHRRRRFDDAFEAEGVRLSAIDRQAQARLSHWRGTVSRLERDLGRIQQRAIQDHPTGRLWERPQDGYMAGQLAAYERDLGSARGQVAYAEKAAREARITLNIHKQERVRRERAIDMVRIAERDQRRAAAREAAGIAPPEDDAEVFTIADPFATVVAHLKSGGVSR